jgi:hypothetical protein
MSTLNGMTLDQIRDQAQRQSAGGYSAVVEITTYLSNRPHTTVMTSNQPIESFSRGGRFVGVMSQFRDGKPFGSAPVVAAKSRPELAPGELPF